MFYNKFHVGEIATTLTIIAVLLMGAGAIIGSKFTQSPTNTSSRAADSCDTMANNKTGGSPAGIVAGTNKTDVTNACNPACCEFNSQCPSGQQCNIPNGFCKSGFSCNASISGQTALKCMSNQCVWQPCDGANCTNECNSNADCGGSSGGTSGGTSAGTSGGTTGGAGQQTTTAGGDCFSNMTVPSNTSQSATFSVNFTFDSSKFASNALNCGIQFGNREEFVTESGVGCSGGTNGSQATFTCKAPSTAGSYKVVCYAWAGAPTCQPSNQDIRANFTVGSTSTQPTVPPTAPTNTPVPATATPIPTNTPIPTPQCLTLGYSCGRQLDCASMSPPRTATGGYGCNIINASYLCCFPQGVTLPPTQTPIPTATSTPVPSRTPVPTNALTTLATKTPASIPTTAAGSATNAPIPTKAPLAQYPKGTTCPSVSELKSVPSPWNTDQIIIFFTYTAADGKSYPYLQFVNKTDTTFTFLDVSCPVAPNL